MVTYNNKPVYFLERVPRVQEKSCIRLTWSEDVPTWTYGDINWNASGIISPGTKKQFIKAIEAKHVDTIKEDSTLYFTSFSEYPRFKLTDTSFKRCIKPNKANYYVINNLRPNITELNNIFLMEDTVGYYLMRSDMSYYEYKNTGYHTGDLIPNSTATIACDYFKKRELMYGTDLKVVYTGSIIYGSKDVELLLNNTTMDIILDSELDATINSNFDTITEDDLKAIEEMLDSPDVTTRGLGLKMLIGYDVGKTPFAIRTILGIRQRKLLGISEWTSVGFQQVLSSIKWSGFGSFPLDMNSITNPIGYKFDGGKEDIKLVQGIYQRAANKYLSTCVKNLENIAKAADLNITFNIERNEDEVDCNSGT